MQAELPSTEQLFTETSRLEMLVLRHTGKCRLQRMVIDLQGEAP